MGGKRAFQEDLEKCYFLAFKTRTPRLFQRVLLLMRNMGLHCVAVYRFGRTVERIRKRHKVIGKIMYIVYILSKDSLLFLHKVDLNRQADIGPGFHICHVGNIYISARKIGENCTLTHNVTIGLGLARYKGRLPAIGKNVWIGTASVIAGDITIGDGATISAGSIVTRDVPAGCLVAGNPARVINREYDNSGLIAYRMNEKRMQPEDSQKDTSADYSEGTTTTTVGCIVDG